MKRYTAPMLNCVELRIEERIASNCTGSCNEWQVENVPWFSDKIALNSAS